MQPENTVNHRRCFKRRRRGAGLEHRPRGTSPFSGQLRSGGFYVPAANSVLDPVFSLGNISIMSGAYPGTEHPAFVVR
jgi:hypothetical protein